MSISGAGFGKGIPNFDESEEAKSDGPLKNKKTHIKFLNYNYKRLPLHYETNQISNLDVKLTFDVIQNPFLHTSQLLVQVL